MITLRDYQKDAVNCILSAETKGIIVAMPTGTGKSIVIASSIKQILLLNRNAKILMITHSSKLVEQNAKTMAKFINEDRIGICSASVKKFNEKELNKAVIFGTIQSFKHKNNDKVKYMKKPPTHIFVDECHLISFNENSQYFRLIKDAKEENDNLIIIGLSATPYRTKTKRNKKNNNENETLRITPMTDHPFFDRQIINLCTPIRIQQMINDGFMCSLTTEKVSASFDTKQVKIDNRTGDFEKKELNKAVIGMDINQRCVQQIIDIGTNKNCGCWIIFTCSIEHAERVRDIFISKNITAKAVHSKMNTAEVNTNLQAFKDGKIKCLVNNDMLTTGFDNPAIDLIGLLRPTQSLSLYIQMLGRGTRIFTNKTSCLLLDFGENIERHGCFDNPIIRNVKKKSKSNNFNPSLSSSDDGDDEVKECPQCKKMNHRQATYCNYCDCFLRDITETASDRPIMFMDKERKQFILAEKMMFSKGQREKQIVVHFFTQQGRFPLYLSLYPDNDYIVWSQKMWSAISGGIEKRATYEYLERFISKEKHDIKDKEIYVHVTEKMTERGAIGYRSVKNVKRFK